MPAKATKKTVKVASSSAVAPSESKFILVDHGEGNVSYIRAEHVVSLHKRFEEIGDQQIEKTEILLIDGRMVLARQNMSGIVKALDISLGTK